VILDQDLGDSASTRGTVALEVVTIGRGRKKATEPPHPPKEGDPSLPATCLAWALDTGPSMDHGHPGRPRQREANWWACLPSSDSRSLPGWASAVTLILPWTEGHAVKQQLQVQRPCRQWPPAGLGCSVGSSGALSHRVRHQGHSAVPQHHCPQVIDMVQSDRLFPKSREPAGMHSAPSCPVPTVSLRLGCFSGGPSTGPQVSLEEVGDPASVSG
jgi:hypothetical protein